MKKTFLIVPLLFMAVSALALTASFSFYQEDLSQAFSDISMQFNVPIVVDQGVIGKVTANLNDVTLKEAMDLLCKKAGLFYFERNGVYFVGSSSSSAKMKMYGYETQVIPLKYLNAQGAVSFLTNYSQYISYSANEPLLLFNGPKEIYDEVLKTLQKLDVKMSQMYVTYTIYKVSNDTWQNGGQNFGILSQLHNSNGFNSVDFDEFFRESKHFELKSSGFAMVNVGKIADFKVEDMNTEIKIQVTSSNPNQTDLTVEASNTLNSYLSVKSAFSLSKGKVGVAQMRNGENRFLVEVNVVKPSEYISKMANMWPEEEKKKETYLSIRGCLNYVAFDAFGRYKNMAVGVVKKAPSYPVVVYGGISEELAENLYGYAFLGVTVPATFDSLNSYRLKLLLVQVADGSTAVMPSGYASVEMPLNDLSDFSIDYVGNLEYKIDSLFVGGSVHYTYDKSGQSFTPLLSVGLFFNKNLKGRLLYSPFEKTFRGEINFEM
ncbi:hypothetical protein [Mesoaciditoga lauensis]|uniref:hypothetical protein n=1 Tax=Mesoaciditoga lauensis TaxID=1495039 RepID=UPI00055DBB1C|nr:hypothetical protein [Mesoaciditoga lauensis]